MRASGKVDFIPRFKPQTNRPDVPFQPRSGIEHSTHVVRAQIIDRLERNDNEILCSVNKRDARIVIHC